MAGSVFNAPTFLVAKSPQALSQLMLKNNMAHGYEFKYFDIQFANGKWYAWYFKNRRAELKQGVKVDG